MKKNNFDIELNNISIKTDLFVPCGAPSHQGKKSNDKIDFEIKINEKRKIFNLISCYFFIFLCYFLQIKNPFIV